MSSATAQSQHLLEVVNATFGYGGIPVVRVNALTLVRSRCLGVFGPNGSGKTTLIRGVTGLISPLSGTVIRPPLADPEISYESRSPSLRFGYLPQYRGVDLTWPMSGFDAAALALSGRARWGWISSALKQRLRQSMKRLDVESLATRPFSTLSGGQQQRLLLAGALAAEPDSLFLDEPTDGLDVRSRHNLLSLLRVCFRTVEL